MMIKCLSAPDADACHRTSARTSTYRTYILLSPRLNRLPLSTFAVEREDPIGRKSQGGWCGGWWRMRFSRVVDECRSSKDAPNAEIIVWQMPSPVPP